MPASDRTAVSTFDRVAIDLRHEPFPQLAAGIRARIDRVLKHWRSASLKAMPHLDGMTLQEFENTIAEILSAAADALQSADPKRLRGVIDSGPGHGLDRFVQKQSLLDLFEEVRILRGVVIVEIADEMRRPLGIGEAATFHAIFDIIIQLGAMALVQKQNEIVLQSQATTVEMNQQLLVSAARRNELLDQAHNAEKARQESEDHLAWELSATRTLQELSAHVIEYGEAEDLYQHIVDAAALIMRSDMASMQTVDESQPLQPGLRLLAFRGFDAEFRKVFAFNGRDTKTSCTMAWQVGRRVIVPDVEASEHIVGEAELPSHRTMGIRAVQSTPLISRDGRTLGVISTHWRNPHVPTEDDLRQFDILARQAADLVERKRAEEELRESEARYRTLFDLGPVAIYSIDSAGVIQHFNRQAANLWGREPAVGATDERFCGSFKMFRPDGTFMPHDQCPMAEVVTGKVSEVRDAEVAIEQPDGSRVTVVVNIRPLINQRGEVSGAVNCFYDITERVAMESQIKLQADALAGESRRKDEFLAMLSHELRNPLAPIRSAVHLLKTQAKGSENPIHRQAHEIIDRQVANMTKLISDLLEVSRVTSGRIRLERQVTDVGQILAHAVETVAPMIESRKHTISLNLCAQGGAWVDADAARIEEVFINLLNNAAKYTEVGGHIEVCCEHPGGDHVQVRVRDNGIGIDPRLMPRIFDLFTQADRSLDRSQGGLGVGLSLAHRLVELHGGTIEAHSPPAGSKVGSEFIVKLPMVPAPEQAVQNRKSIPASQPTDGVRVLVVDDNADLVSMSVTSLRDLGYSVQSATTGPDGIEIVRQWHPHIVLLDIGLPGMDGYEVARRLRSHQNGVDRKVPRLIAVTGYGRDADIALARQVGFDGHLVKPYDFDKLEELIKSLTPMDAEERSD